MMSGTTAVHVEIGDLLPNNVRCPAFIYRPASARATWVRFSYITRDLRIKRDFILIF